MSRASIRPVVTLALTAVLALPAAGPAGAALLPAVEGSR